MANTKNRGFASMDSDKQRQIASKGGKAAHMKGTAHEWTSEEARAAGRKGGESRGVRGAHETSQLETEGATGFGTEYRPDVSRSSTVNPETIRQAEPANNVTSDLTRH